MRGELTLIAIDALDKLSKCRALDDIESWTLQRLITSYERTATGAARLAAWRKSGLVMAMHVPAILEKIDQCRPGEKKLVNRLVAAQRAEPARDAAVMP